MFNLKTLFQVVTVCCLWIFHAGISASELYFIDAHSQVDHKIDNMQLILDRMDKTGVYTTILAARSRRRPTEVADFAEQHPKRIIAAVRTKSGAYIKGKKKYYKKISKQVDSGRYRGMAEVLLFHAQKGDKAPEVYILPDDERVQYALQAAQKNGWPFVIHIEFASLDSDGRAEFMAAMEKLLSSNPDQPFLLNHMGQLPSADVQRLIKRHANIHFLTAHTTPVAIRNSRQPWVNLFEGGKLASNWKTLMVAHPDRFVFALDNVWAEHWQDFYLEKMAVWRGAVADLPEEVAHAFAHGNAERLWKLPARQ